MIVVSREDPRKHNVKNPEFWDHRVVFDHIFSWVSLVASKLGAETMRRQTCPTDGAHLRRLLRIFWASSIMSIRLVSWLYAANEAMVSEERT